MPAAMTSESGRRTVRMLTPPTLLTAFGHARRHTRGRTRDALACDQPALFYQHNSVKSVKPLAVFSPIVWRGGITLQTSGGKNRASRQACWPKAPGAAIAPAPARAWQGWLGAL